MDCIDRYPKIDGLYRQLKPWFLLQESLYGTFVPDHNMDVPA